MSNLLFWQIIAWTFWTMAIVLLVVKYKYTIHARQNYNREIHHKWIGWYNDLKIQGTSSQRFRKFMQISNRINTSIWLAIALGMVCLLMYRYGH